MQMMKGVGVLGMTVTLCFFLGIGSMLIYNPQILREDMMFTILNFVDLPGRLWAADFIYLTVGFLAVLYGLGLIKTTRNYTPLLVGKLLLIASGIQWGLFGFRAIDFQVIVENLTEAFIHAMMGGLFYLTGACSLIFFGVGTSRIIKNNFLKYYSLASGILMLVLVLFLPALVDMPFHLRWNLPVAIYFLWFGIYGRALTQLAKSPQVD